MKVGPTRRARLLLATIVMVGSLLMLAGLAEACRPSDPNPSIQTVGGSYSTSFNPSPGANYYWKVYVPPGSPGGASYLQVRTTGPACNVPEACTDVDLYVRKGAIPNDGAYDCRPFLWEANEACYFSSPGADWWYIRVYSYTDDPTNPNALVRLIVSHDGSENLAPQPVADAYLVDEDTTTMFDVLSNDSDPDLTRIPGATDELSVTSAGPTDLGQSVSVDGGKVQYDAAAGVSGMDAFSYSVSDGCGGSASAEVTVTVNARPVAEDDGPYLLNQDGPVLLLDGLLDNDSDAFYSTFSGPEEDAALRINEIVAPPGKGTATISGDGLAITYDPTDTQSGTDAFTYQVTDGRLNATATVTIDVNARPMAADDFANVPQDDPGTDMDVRGNDGDPFWSAGSGAVSFPTDLTVVQTTDPSPLGGTVEIIQGGTAVSYTPPPGAVGTDSFTYTLSDGRLTDTATVTVTVEEAENQAPTAQDDPSYSTSFESPLSVAAAGVLANDEDADEDELRAIPVDPPANAAPDSFLLRDDGSFEYTPAQDFFGQDTFTYQAHDGTAPSGVATVTITVGEPAPGPVPDAWQSTLTADPAEIAADGEASSDVILQVKDTEGQPYFDPAGPPPILTSSHGTLTAPQHQGGGVWVATLTCTDAGSATINATVEEEAVPDEPVVECLEPEPEDNGAPVADGQELNMDEDGSLPITLTATDPDGHNITFSLLEPVPSGLAGTAPALTYTPAADSCTPGDPVSFQFRARDPFGAAGTATVTIDVGCVDDAPMAQDDTASVDADGTVTIDVLQNDADADEEYGDTIALLPFPDGATSAEGGAIAVEDGQVTYTAPPGFASPPLDTFQYTAEDGAGLTSTATVMVTVIPPNLPPEAQDATMSIPQGASAEILLEATDDHDEAAALLFEVASPTDLGVPITSVGQSVAYTSPGDVCGVVDTFEFTVTDPEGLEDTGRVRLHLVCPETAADPAPAPHDQDVEPALHPPRGATPIEATGGEHVTIRVTPPRDAPAGATISYSQAGGPAVLDAEWHPGEGRLVFVAPTPQPGQSIVQTLHFTLTLGDAASLPLIIDVVTHRADAVPVVVASASPAQAAAGAEVVLDASGSTHSLGLPLAFAWDQVSGMPVELPASDQATASFTAPAVPPGGSATLVFSVTAQAGGRSATEEVTVRVDSPAPSAAPAAPPSATFEAVPRGDGAILFRAEGDAAAKYEWDFGDGERAEGREVLHRFDQGGDFTVQLRVDDDAGSETASKDVVVADPVSVATADGGTPLWAVLTVAAAGLLAVAVAGAFVVRAARRR